jgi:ATP-dependent exoDNAse (exonuclease V) beta subunit
VLKRLFYVAATRARKRLYLSATVAEERKPDSNSILSLLWEVPGMQQEFAPPAPPAELVQTVEDASPELLLRRLSAAYVAPPILSPLQWSSAQAQASGEEHSFEWVGELLPRVGVVAHRFLERIAREGVAHWDGARVAAERPAIAASLLRAGVAHGELEQGIARVSEALRRTLQDERGRWLLSPHPEDRCELAVSAVIDGELQHVRVDRTFVENGTRWLVDYKITEQLGGDLQRFLRMQVDKYRPDMQRYVRALYAMDQRPVRCALYLPLSGQLCPVEVEAPQGGSGIANCDRPGEKPHSTV